ncbi:MAG TPA: transcriptional repressor [Planctomycetaceae bacterium]|nr:transcriptional repressor [Planctomycetaceae bacterium]
MSHDRLVEFLRDLARKKIRLTHQRVRVLEVVGKFSSSFTAEDIVKAFSEYETDRNVSRSTVYRMLKLLEDSGLISKIPTTDGLNTYLSTEILRALSQVLSIDLHNLVAKEVDPAEFMEVDPSLCDSMHRTMIAGTCPWCGREIFEIDES